MGRWPHIQLCTNPKQLSLLCNGAVCEVSVRLVGIDRMKILGVLCIGGRRVHWSSDETRVAWVAYLDHLALTQDGRLKINRVSPFPYRQHQMEVVVLDIQSTGYVVTHRLECEAIGWRFPETEGRDVRCSTPRLVRLHLKCTQNASKTPGNNLSVSRTSNRTDWPMRSASVSAVSANKGCDRARKIWLRGL